MDLRRILVLPISKVFAATMAVKVANVPIPLRAQTGSDYIVSTMEIAQTLSTNSKAHFSVGHLSLCGQVMLAPMAGVTDTAMRRIASRAGATLTFSEMVASTAFLGGEVESRLRSDGSGVFPNAVQLVGREAQAMAETARRLEGEGVELIDVNMGCPARRVAGALAGSALMRDLDAAENILSAVVRAVRVPVSVKMRLGWDDTSLNAPQLARRAESSGVLMVTVHARTRCQFYNGRANWAAVRETVNAVEIPVVVNGDARTVEDARGMLTQSRAAAVMIGRGAIGAPWRVGAIAEALATGEAAKEPSCKIRRAAASEHLDFLLTSLGSEAGLRHARKHLSAYAVEADAPEPLRRALVTADSAQVAFRLLSEAFAGDDTRAAA